MKEPERKATRRERSQWRSDSLALERFRTAEMHGERTGAGCEMRSGRERKERGHFKRK